MNLIQCPMKNSTWYKGTRKTTVKGVLWHSTGANNPNIKRYVQPYESDADYDKLIKLLGKNTNKNDWNHINREAGVHAWIGKLADGSVATVQVGPWDFRAWGCASGPKGSCNNGWIQFEICEDGLNDKSYFDKVYKEACELTAYLCKIYNLDPFGVTTEGSAENVPVILCHQDSYKLGVGSNHGDVLHWFSKFGKTMDDVRSDVAAIISGTSTTTNKVEESEPVSDEKKIWDFLFNKIGNSFGVAGLMGNLYAESALRSNNLQNTYEKSLGLSDVEYTKKVDNGSYTNFVKDSAGYGLAQWTYYSRKQNLINYAKSNNKSIGDLTMQLEFLYKELSESYPKVLSSLESAKSVSEASTIVLTEYERPANQSASVKATRTKYGNGYYNKYNGSKPSVVTEKPITNVPLTFNDISINEVFNFNGKSQYTSSQSDTPVATKYTGRVKVTIKGESKSKHPIHVRSVDNTGKLISGVYGWVDIDSLSSINFKPYLVKITASVLNIRKGPSTAYGINGTIRDRGIYTIVEESNGFGKLKSGAGWISLKYTSKVKR